MPLLPPLQQDDSRVLVTRPMWLTLILVPVLLAFFAPALRPMLLDPVLVDYVLDARASREFGAEQPAIGFEGTWEAAPGGVSPTDGAIKDAVVTIDVPPGFWDSGRVTLLAAPESRWMGRLSRQMRVGDDIRLESYSLRDLQTDKPFEIGTEMMPAPGDAPTSMTLRLFAAEAGRSASSDFALFRGVTVRFSAKAPNRLLSFADVVAASLLPLLIAAVARVWLAWSSRRAHLAGIAGGILAAAALSMKPDQTGGLAAFTAAISAAGAAQAFMLSRGWVGARRKSLALTPEQWTRAGAILLVTMVVLVALQTRWIAFEEARRSPISPDEAGFLIMSWRGGALYDTWQPFAPWIREPFFPWLLRMWFLFAPRTAASGHFLGMVLSVGAVAAVALVGMRAVGTWAGIGAALILAASPFWAVEGARVLRLDLTLLLMMGAMALRQSVDEKPWWRSALWGLLGAAMVLTRLSALAFVVPVIAWEAWRRKWIGWEIVLAVVLLALPVLPHLGFNYRYEDSHDYFRSSTVHTRFYANRDFAGTRGFPTKGEVAADPYAGEPMGAGTYMLKHHGPVGTMIGHVKGYWRLFVWGVPRERFALGHEWALLPGLLGLWVLLRAREKRWIFAWFALAMFPFAFIASRGADFRLGAEAAVLSLWVWSAGVQAAIVFAGERIAAWRAARKAAAG